MAEQNKLDVSRWQPSRPGWNYDAALWFWYRMIEVAYLDARSKRAGAPTDEALLARDWIARSESEPPLFARSDVALAAGIAKPFVSFPECCRTLGLDADAERSALLSMIDRAVDVDTDAAWTRLEELSAADPEDDTAFEGFRVVPALDQISLF